MKRLALALTALAPLVLTACVEAPPQVDEPVSDLRPLSGPPPIDVLRALPAGVSTTTLRQDAAGCYFYDPGTGPEPVTAPTTAGNQPVCA